MTPNEARLREENDTLREEVRQLRALLVVERPLPPEWKLSKSESIVFRAILPREMATKEHILNALYWDRCDDWPDSKILEVLICKMRKKLDKHGVHIFNKYGLGYFLDEKVRATILGRDDVRQSAPQEVQRRADQDGGCRLNLHQAG
jgi:two-component system cell cycle response regulator CtrA